MLLQDLRVPFLLNGWELCEATDIGALETVSGVRRSGVRTGTRSSQPIARYGTHKIKQIARVAKVKNRVTGVYEPNMQHAVTARRTATAIGQRKLPYDGPVALRSRARGTTKASCLKGPNFVSQERWEGRSHAKNHG